MNDKDAKDNISDKLGKNKNNIFHNKINRNDKSYKKFIIIFIRYLDTVLMLNIFFIGTCLSIVGIGPSLISMTKSFLLISENKIEKRYSTYFINFKKYFNLVTVFFGLIIIGLLAGLFYLFIFFYTNTPTAQYLIVPWILDIFLILFIICFSSYFSLMYLRIDLSVKTIIKNSIYLAVGGIKNNIFCSLSFIIIFVIPLIFVIQTFVLFITIVFSTTVLACMFSVYTLVDKYVIYPYDYETVDQKDDKSSKLNLSNSNINEISNNKEENLQDESSDNEYDYDDESKPL